MILFLLACFSSSAPPRQTPADTLRHNPLKLTRHARERMDCRHISRQEVERIQKHGKNIPKRARTDGACPSFAFEGPDDDGGSIRVVFAACPGITKVVTAIDLDDSFKCQSR